MKFLDGETKRVVCLCCVKFVTLFIVCSVFLLTDVHSPIFQLVDSWGGSKLGQQIPNIILSGDVVT